MLIIVEITERGFILSLKHGLLGLLSQSPKTGYELDKQFNALLGSFWQAKTSQIYRELDTMEKTGWLSSERVLQEEKPNKRVYSITYTGQSEFEDWMQHGAIDLSIKSAFLMRIFFADNNQIAGLLRTYLNALEELKEALGGNELTQLFIQMINQTKRDWVQAASGGFVRPNPPAMEHKLGGYDYEVFPNEVRKTRAISGADKHSELFEQVQGGILSPGGYGHLHFI